MKISLKCFIVFIFLVGVSACGESESGSANVVIVQVHCEKRTGEPDCRTIVQNLENNTRYSRVGNWGEVGDTFLVKNLNSSSIWSF